MTPERIAELRAILRRSTPFEYLDNRLPVTEEEALEMLDAVDSQRACASVRTNTAGTTADGQPERKQSLIPIILCAGENGRALVYGYVQSEPIPGQPVRLERARMVLMYPSGGTFGLAADGPPPGSRVTHAVEVTTETRWQEWLKVSPAAAEVFDGWK